MRSFFQLVAIGAVLGGAATAQVIPETQDIPGAITAQMSAEGLLDGMSGWSFDIDNDGDADWFIQAAYSSGGNSVNFIRRVYRTERGGFMPVQDLDLIGGIKEVRLEGRVVVITLYRLMPNDARCCPSGLSEARFQL